MYKNILKAGEWVETCNASDMDAFDVGIVLAVDDEGVLLASVDPQGKEDGIVYVDFSIMNIVRKDTQYIHKMKKLVEAYHENLENIDEAESDLKKQLLKKCMANNKIVSISLTDGVEVQIEGFVEKIDGNICVVNEYDVYGKPDGQVFCALEDICRLAYNRQKIRKLYTLVQ